MRRKLPDDMGRGSRLWVDLRRRRGVSWPGGGGRGRRSGRRGGRRWGSWRTGGNGDQQTAAVSCFCHNCSAWNEVAPLKEDGKLETGRWWQGGWWHRLGWVAELETISGQTEVTALQSTQQSVRRRCNPTIEFVEKVL